MRKPKGIAATLLLCYVFTLLLCNTAAAGKLQDFKDDITEDRTEEQDKQEVKKKKKKHCKYAWDCDHKQKAGDDEEWSLTNMILDTLFYAFSLGGDYSTERVSGDYGYTGIVPRAPGEPIIPYLRFDFNYQLVDSYIDGLDFRAEGGFGAFGGQARMTMYNDSAENETLTLTELHFLYRMSFGNHFGLYPGIGAASIDNFDNESGLSLTVPFYIRLSQMLGFEFKPTVFFINANTIWDLDGSVILSYGHFSMSLGYRRLDAPNTSLEGPYAGVSVVW